MAGRSVGNIEVTVGANTNKLKFQIVKASKEAGEAGGKAIEEGISNVAGRELIAKLRAIRTEAQRAMAGIQVDLDFDDDRVQYGLRRVAAQVRAMQLELTINPNLNDADLQAMLAETRAEIEAAALGEEIEVDGKVIMRLDVPSALKTVEDADAALELAQDTIDARVELVDEAEFHAEVATIIEEAEADSRALRVEMEVEAREFMADMRRALHEAEALNPKIRAEMELETREALFDYVGFKETVELDTIHARVETDVALAEVRADRALLEEIMGDLGIPVDPETLKATAELTKWRQREEAKDIKLNVDIQRSLLDTSRGAGGIGDLFERSGSGAGDSFGRGLSLRMKAIVAGITLLAEPAAVLLQGSLAAATSVLSSAFSGLGGALGPLPAGMAALGATVTTLIVGFQGLGDALGAVSEEFATAAAEGRAFNMNAEGIAQAMRGLAPEAQDFVRAFSQISPQLTEVRRAVQDRLFEGLGDTLRDVAQGALPAISAGLEEVAGSLNTFFRGLGERMQSMDFSGIFRSLQPVIDRMLDSFLNLFDAFEPFIKAAAPAAAMLADSFADTTASLSRMIAAGAKSGGLSNFLKDGVDSLKQWWELTRNVGDALFTVFEAGKASGDSFVKSLSTIVKRWDDWMESAKGQEALFDFFETGRRIIKALEPVLKGLKGFFDELITPGSIDRFEEFADGIGELLPTLGKLLSIVGETEILNTFVDLLNTIGSAIKGIEPELRELAKVFGDVLSDAVRDLSPVFRTITSTFADLTPVLATVARTAGDAFGSFLDAVKPLIPMVGELAEIAGENLIANLDALTPVFDTIATAIAELMDPLGTLIESLGRAFVEALDASIPLIELAAEVLEVLIGFVSSAADVFSALPDPIQSVVTALGFLLLVDIGGFGKKVADTFKGMRDNITLLRPALQDAGGAFRTTFQGMASFDFAKVTTGMKNLGPSLAQVGKSGAAAAGTAIAGALGIAFGAQMINEADGMAGKVTGALTIATSAITAFAVGGPIVGTVTMGLGLITAGFQAQAERLKDAKEAARDYADILAEIEGGADVSIFVARFRQQLEKESDKTSEMFRDMGLDVGEWARSVVTGTKTAEEATADWLETMLGANDPIVEGLRNHTITVDELGEAFDRADDSAKQVGGRWQGLGDQADNLGYSMDNVEQAIGFLADEQANLLEGQSDLETSTALFGDSLLTEEERLAAAAEAATAAGEAHEGYAITSQSVEGAALGVVLAMDVEAIATEGVVDALGLVPGAQADAAGAAAATMEALEEEKTAMYEASEAAKNLAANTEEAAKAMALDIGFPEEFIDGFLETAEAAKEAADAADAFLDVIEKFVSPAKDAEAAFSDVQQAIDDIAIALQGGDEAISLREEAWEKAAEAAEKYAEAEAETDPERAADIRKEADALLEESEAANLAADGLAAAAKSMDQTTQEGRDAIEMLHGHSDAIHALIAAEIRQGTTVDEVTALHNEQREALIKNAEAYGQTREEAEAYADKLLGTPQFVNTLIQTPGLLAALADVESLTLSYDAAGQPVITEIEALGIELTAEQVNGLMTLYGNLDDTVAQPEVIPPAGAAETETAAADAGTALNTLDQTTAAPHIFVEGAPQLNETISEATRRLRLIAGEQAMAAINADPSAFEAVMQTYNTQMAAIDQAEAEGLITADNQASAIIAEASGLAIAFGEIAVSANLTATDNSAPVVETATANVNDFGFIIGMATIGVNDNANPVIDAAEINVADYTSLTGIANLTATDHSGPVVQDAKDGIEEYARTPADVELTTSGTAPDDIEGVRSAAEVLNGTGVDVTVEIREAQQAKRAIEGLSLAVEEMPKTAVLTFSAPNAATVKTELRTLKERFDELEESKEIEITQKGVTEAITAVGTLDRAIDNLNSRTVYVQAAVYGLSTVYALDAAIRNLRDRTVYVTTIQRTFSTFQGIAPTMAGDFRTGNTAGEMVRSPTTFGNWSAGERGYAEAVIPMHLPINRVSPEVRELAILLRGGGRGGGPTKIVNNNLNITPNSADPAAVAEKVINRAVALANI